MGFIAISVVIVLIALLLIVVNYDTSEVIKKRKQARAGKKG